MKNSLRIILLVLSCLCTSHNLRAQYYSWGADRSSLKWSTIERDSVTVLYPDTVEVNARRVMHYIESIKGDVSYEFKHPPLKIPFVIHPENFASNGMVMWMPIRVEFLSTPSTDSYSMPWVKQLVTHEYRHAVQYNNLDRSTIKVCNVLLGQQGAAVSLLFPPLYALEGDAVMMETQMSTYGRGLQPSFTIGYRALADELMDESDFLKWRCGSYRAYIPDHYQMGYQIMSYAYDKYGENILNKAFEYTSRNPQFISPYSIALRKFYDTSTKELTFETFGALKEFWESQPQVENSATILSEKEEHNFVKYSYPSAIEGDKVLALKYDYREPTRFVVYDPKSSEERKIAHTGSVSTRPAYAAGRVWWTEYRRSPLFDEYVNSQLCYMDIERGKPQKLKGYKSALYPTPLGESKNRIAYVEYNPTGEYSVVELLDGDLVKSYPIPFPNEVHSMAWDNLTERLYIIVTGESGMWIEQQCDSGFEPLTKAAYITLSNLRAKDGVLYFGSIASGKDEVHSLDIASGVERQLSQSTYGSFDGSIVGDEIYMTTYDKDGYHLSSQSAEQSIKVVEYSNTPNNLVNPERKKWDVINLDTLSFDSLDLALSKEKYKSKKYRKGSHLINVHSWAPMSFDPLAIISETSLDIGLGATLVSQNLLSSCESFLSYGWDHYEGSVVKGGMNYNGLGVNLSLSASYGGGDQVAYLIGSDYQGRLKRYADLSLSASLPLYFSRGYHNRALTLYAGWSYSNGIVPEGDLEYEFIVNSETEELEDVNLLYNKLEHGLNKLSMGVTYSSYLLSAYRDLSTPLGYTASASYSVNPGNADFSQLLVLYGKIYTPGLAKNNSFTVAAAYQDVLGGFEINDLYPLSYKSSALIPRGFTSLDMTNNDYFAASAEYKLPLCYPEFGVFNFLYFKRLSLGLGADYARFKYYGGTIYSINSYGGSLMFDVNALSMTSASTITLTTSLYKPKDRNLYFLFGLSLPF